MLDTFSQRLIVGVATGNRAATTVTMTGSYNATGGNKMAVSVDDVRMQCGAFIDALEGMPTKQKESSPSRQYLDQFNSLLEIAKEAIPDKDERLWPKPLSPENKGMTSMVTASYVEVETYVRQIMAILPPAPYI